MRIIAGRAKRTRLSVPATGTRPMTGRARESVFSILAPRLDGARVLDLFAGSGALGLEALSRGAAVALFVESDRSARAVIEDNIASVGLGGVVMPGSLPRAIGGIDGDFGIVFVDPPYRDSDDSVNDLLAALDAVLAHDGVVVLHRQARSRVDTPDFLTCAGERRYGDAVVLMFERLQS